MIQYVYPSWKLTGSGPVRSELISCSHCVYFIASVLGFWGILLALPWLRWVQCKSKFNGNCSSFWANVCGKLTTCSGNFRNVDKGRWAYLWCSSYNHLYCCSCAGISRVSSMLSSSIPAYMPGAWPKLWILESPWVDESNEVLHELIYRHLISACTMYNVHAHVQGKKINYAWAY